VQELVQQAESLGLDAERFRQDLLDHMGAERIAEDLSSAAESGASGTPTFFINGRWHRGAYDRDSLHKAVKAARVRANLSP
jgi:predicted DsbA family dithiol-disulfide isomerase